MTNPQPLELVQPLDLQDAREASRKLAEIRRAAEDEHRRLVTASAEAERDYRKAFAVKFIEAVGTNGEREQLARQATADLAYQRDIQAGLARAALERLRGLEGERSMLKSLVEWSQRLSLDGRESERRAA